MITYSHTCTYTHGTVHNVFFPFPSGSSSSPSVLTQIPPSVLCPLGSVIKLDSLKARVDKSCLPSQQVHTSREGTRNVSSTNPFRVYDNMWSCANLRVCLHARTHALHCTACTCYTLLPPPPCPGGVPHQVLRGSPVPSPAARRGGPLGGL